MKRIAVWVLVCASGMALAQAGGNAADSFAQLQARALAAVQAERARAKQPLCPKAMNTVENNLCYQRELGISDGNYRKLVLAVGAMLRSHDEAKAAPTRITFDDAETAWSKYRDAACDADGAWNEGGTIRPSAEMGCKITLVRHHMDELWALYSDLGTR